MKISELMTRHVGSCRPEDPTNQAARIMWECDCGCVPVIDSHNKVVGMITDRDICMAAYFNDRRLKDIQVQEVMSSDPQCCTLDDSVEAAEELMQLHRIRRLPVVDENGTLCGVVSLNDLALECERRRSEIQPEEISITLGAICAHD